MVAIIYRRLKYVVMGLLVAVLAYFFLFSRTNSCGFTQNKFIIGTIRCGPFSEYIPQIGAMELDTTTMEFQKVKVVIDELFLSRISVGLVATTEMNGRLYQLEITKVYPIVLNGRFEVDMCFKSEMPKNISDSKSLRMRIELSDPCDQIILPMGNFFLRRVASGCL